MTLRFNTVHTSDQVLAQTVANETVLLDLKSEKYFGLDAVGSRVWALLQETDDVAAVRGQLLREFEVAESVLDQDLNELFDRLQQAGLIQGTRGQA